MTIPSFRDIEQLSALLDEQLPQADAARLESRIASDPELAATLADLRLARTMLRRMPKRRAPRNFTLTPRMARIRPPIPRLVPAFSWASALAALVFIFTLGANLIGNVALASKQAASAPAGLGVGGGYGGGGGGGAPDNYPTQAPLTAPNPVLTTPTPQLETFSMPAATPTGADRTLAPGGPQAEPAAPAIPWFILWPALALLLLGVALLLRWNSLRRFRRRNPPK